MISSTRSRCPNVYLRSVVSSGPRNAWPRMKSGNESMLGKTQHGRSKILEADQPVDRFTGGRRRKLLVLFRESNQQRHVHPGVKECSFVSRHAAAVVGIEKDNRVVRQAIGLRVASGFRRPACPSPRRSRNTELRFFAPAACLGNTEEAEHEPGSWTSLAAELTLDFVLELLVGPDHRS